MERREEVNQAKLILGRILCIIGVLFFAYFFWYIGFFALIFIPISIYGGILMKEELDKKYPKKTKLS